MSTKITVTFNVNFSALDNLILYLNKVNDSQPKIDALTAQVKLLTARLETTNVALEGAVTDAPK